VTRRRLTIVVLLLASALVASLRADAAPRKGETVAFIPAVLANPAQQAIAKGFQNQARKLALSPAVLGGEFNPQAQITAVNAAIQRRVTVLAIWPLDPKSLRPTLDRARRGGMKILTIWTAGLPGATADIFYDETPAARRVAALAAQTIKRSGDECKVGIIQGLPVVPILKARNDALEAGARAAGCEVLERQVNQKDSADGALPIVQAWRTKYGSEMTAILAYNDPSALGAVAAATGSFRPVITGMNGDPAAIDAIRNGRMLATTTVPNAEVGNALAWAANQVIGRKKVPRSVSAQCDVLTRANLGKYVPWSVRNRRALTVKFVKQGSRWIVKTTPDYSLR
jgi:ribose transport system substrate-binding protein